MRFTKMHGAGNDYVYVNCFAEPFPTDPAALARRVSDRHFGIGGDGLILICPSEKADARMRMYNADGSESEMCGNGIRCVAKYVYDHGISRRSPLKIETGRGALNLELEIDENSQKVGRVRVDMGEPILEPARIPVEFPRPFEGDRIVDFPSEKYIPFGQPASWMEDCGFDSRMTCVSMGNPHVVFFCQYISSFPLEMLGPYLERQPIFPNRTNLHVVQVVSPKEVVARTWERGSGVTLACGTGACAVCVAGALTGRTSRKILAHLPGGDLELEWAENDHVFMTGEAVEVFAGDFAG
ncbi:MAG: diaminopimelate epimerase [Pirellulales bacterium]|nr:diaminopimelate epimerase [Pirellulales bacterium]